MGRRAMGGLALLLAGCQPVEPSSDLFAPAPVAAPAPAPSPEGEAPAEAPAPAEGDAGYDFEADARPPDEEGAAGGAGPLSPAEVAEGLGLDPNAVPKTPTPATPTPPPAEAPPAAPAPTPPPPLMTSPAAWGVRLVSTVPDAQPPRAILGLGDGREEVVWPGKLLPDAGVVVLAVGRDAVHIARITPDGDHARVETELLQALYPGAPPGR